MRITIVIGAFLPLPPGPAGAVERRWYHTGLTLAALGHDVTFVSRSYAGQEPDETNDRVRFIRRSGFSRTGWVYFDLLKDLLYSIRILFALPDADVVVMNVFWLPVLAAFFKPRAGKVAINVARVPKGQMWLYRRCARLAACSQAIRDDIAAQCPDVIPITRVLPNPVNTNVFTPPPNGRDYSGQRTIVFTGRVHPEKGLPVLIEAFARLCKSDPNLRLRIVGPWRPELGGGGERFLRELKQKAEGLPMQFDEPIHEPAKLAEVLQQAHYYCYPTFADKGEASPVAPKEAMATGLAPVVSNIPQFRDFIEDGVHGIYFDYRSPDVVGELTAALRKLIDNPELAQRMGEAAARRAHEFSYTAVAQKWIADFKELLGAEPLAQEPA